MLRFTYAPLPSLLMCVLSAADTEAISLATCMMHVLISPLPVNKQLSLMCHPVYPPHHHHHHHQPLITFVIIITIVITIVVTMLPGPQSLRSPVCPIWRFAIVACLDNDQQNFQP